MSCELFGEEITVHLATKNWNRKEFYYKQLLKHNGETMQRDNTT